MDFGGAVRVCLQEKYAKFDGRASRSEFWWFVLAYFIVKIVVGIVAGILSAISPTIGMVLNFAIGLALLVPYIAVFARRMHDVDKSGWFMLIPFYNLYLAVQKGTSGSNRFGEDTLTAGLADTFR